jgi:O-antigen/teichoic acid export membrane protein
MVRRFVRLSLGYGVVGSLSAAFSFLLLPLYTRLLPPAAYGVIDVLLTLTNLIVALVLLGVDQALNAFFFDGDELYQARLSGTALGGVLVIAFGIWIVLIAAAPLLVYALFGDRQYASLLYLISINVIVLPLLTTLTSIYRLRQRVRRVNFIGLLGLCLNLIAVSIFVLWWRLGLLGIALASFVTQSLTALIILLTLRSELRLQVDRGLLRPLYTAGVGLLPATISWLLLVNIDRLMLTQYVTTTELGLYALANKLATLLTIIFTICWSAWLPMALSMAGESGAAQRYAQMFELFAAGSMVLALTFGAFAPELLGLISRAEYQGAAPYVLALMVFTGPMTFIGACFNVAFYASKRTHLVSVVNLAGALVNIVLNLLLNPWLGVWGAVLATLAAGTCSTGLAFVLSRDLLPVSYRWWRLLPVIFFYLSLVTAFVLLPSATIGWKVAAIILLVGAAVGSDLIPRQSLKQLRSVLRPAARAAAVANHSEE